MKIESLDHLVLTVGDIETSCAFYSRVLVGHAVSSVTLSRSTSSISKARERRTSRC